MNQVRWITTALAALAVLLAACPAQKPNTAACSQEKGVAPQDVCPDAGTCAWCLQCLADVNGGSFSLCTQECTTDDNCSQLVSATPEICVNGLCYLSCEASAVGTNGGCPYGEQCMEVGTDAGVGMPANLIGDLCRPQ